MTLDSCILKIITYKKIEMALSCKISVLKEQLLGHLIRHLVSCLVTEILKEIRLINTGNLVISKL